MRRKKIVSYLLLLFWIGALGGCSPEESNLKRAAPIAEQTVDQLKVICLGDGITAGVHLSPEEAYPKVLETALRAEGTAAKVVNAGIKGETMAQGNARVEWLLQQRFQVFVLALGWEDLRRGTDVATVGRELKQLCQKLAYKAPDAQVILIPPPLNTAQMNWEESFRRVADSFEYQVMPHPLLPPTSVPDYWQEQGDYPTAEGQQLIAQRLAEIIIH